MAPPGCDGDRAASTETTHEGQGRGGNFPLKPTFRGKLGFQQNESKCFFFSCCFDFFFHQKIKEKNTVTVSFPIFFPFQFLLAKGYKRYFGSLPQLFRFYIFSFLMQTWDSLWGIKTPCKHSSVICTPRLQDTDTLLCSPLAGFVRIWGFLNLLVPPLQIFVPIHVPDIISISSPAVF